MHRDMNEFIWFGHKHNPIVLRAIHSVNKLLFNSFIYFEIWVQVVTNFILYFIMIMMIAKELTYDKNLNVSIPRGECICSIIKSKQNVMNFFLSRLFTGYTNISCTHFEAIEWKLLKKINFAYTHRNPVILCLTAIKV